MLLYSKKIFLEIFFKKSHTHPFAWENIYDSYHSKSSEDFFFLEFEM